jgi:FMN-dependent NADH-azoreductase
MKLLHLDAGITGDASVTRQISRALVENLNQAVPALEVAYRDLAADPLPHLDGAALGGLADNDVLAQFISADVIVIGAPMYNFGIPTQLKAWIDRVAVAGKTFRYAANGPEGLAGGKTVIVASSRGGLYAGTPMADLDFQERYLRTVFGFLGIDDVTFVRAEGVAISPEHRTAALAGALAQAPKAAAALAPALAA